PNSAVAPFSLLLGFFFISILLPASTPRRSKTTGLERSQSGSSGYCSAFSRGGHLRLLQRGSVSPRCIARRYGKRHSRYFAGQPRTPSDPGDRRSTPPRGKAVQLRACDLSRPD